MPEDLRLRKPITMGVNLTNLNKLMKTVDNSDTSLSTWRTHMNRLAIKVENSGERMVYKLNMLEIEQSHLDIRKMNVRRGLNSSEFSASSRRCPHCPNGDSIH
jgi:hypothetical protein